MSTKVTIKSPQTVPKAYKYLIFKGRNGFAPSSDLT